ncbi:BrnA antitoxin family protein [Tabrizicola caldifontis]|uniref:BrnA antitoxin family protein n=1 Tax=Tabrizicola caldifontis TaxID=2528036 RepID=UPI0010820908
MPDLRKLTPRQAAQMTYMMDVMRHPKWDLHNSIEMTGRIPAEWHEIAQKRPTSGKEKVTLRLEADVLKFFRSMGPDYGPRINDVLRSYMHARLAGVIRGGRRRYHTIRIGGPMRGRSRGSRGRRGRGARRIGWRCRRRCGLGCGEGLAVLNPIYGNMSGGGRMRRGRGGTS